MWEAVSVLEDSCSRFDLSRRGAFGSASCGIYFSFVPISLWFDIGQPFLLVIILCDYGSGWPHYYYYYCSVSRAVKLIWKACIHNIIRLFCFPFNRSPAPRSCHGNDAHVRNQCRSTCLTRVHQIHVRDGPHYLKGTVICAKVSD